MPSVHPHLGALIEMVLWSISTAVLAIWFVFGDPRFDYRTVILGSVIPLGIDLWTGGSWIMHSVTMSVAAMMCVMLATIGRRALRRRLLGLPLGMFLYLVFSGAWADETVFWWPFTGWSPDWGPLPFMGRGLWTVALECAGAAMLWWLARTTGLADPERRQAFVRSGQLQLAQGPGRSTC